MFNFIDREMCVKASLEEVAVEKACQQSPAEPGRHCSMHIALALQSWMHSCLESSYLALMHSGRSGAPAVNLELMLCVLCILDSFRWLCQPPLSSLGFQPASGLSLTPVEAVVFGAACPG